ncbi:MAG: sigma-54-dependent Fis family transcriptional regulator [Syntrophaceae bacterium]|nr:sigma-54-dependent Fis family transcriptional regulator [Syntrophaceae bacterium]
MSNRKKRIRILIIDDEASIRDGCSQVLSRNGYEVVCTGDALEGFKFARQDRYDLILLDLKMPGMKGIDILKKLRKDHDIAAKIIIITGYGTIPLSVEAIKNGADDFLTKPFTSTELRRAVIKVLERKDIDRPDPQVTGLIGNSDYMRELEETIRRIAKTDSTILITGESGTGKELVAQTIHSMSMRFEKPFVPVDCSSLVETLMESALFGHVKGAFSGATESRTARFQMADNGTLFLDEISNISLKVQATLLRVIQEQEIPRVGSSKTESVDVRLIAATNREEPKGRFLPTSSG